MSRILVRPLCEELAKKAQLELNETPKKLEDGIIHLKEWIGQQPHLRARTDDQWLAAFLRGCKHSLERAKEKLDLFYSMRSIAPELTALKYWDPKFKELSKAGIGIVILKRVSPADPSVVLIRASQYDANKYTPTDVSSILSAAQMISHMENDAFAIAGVIILIDLTGLNTNHIAQLTPTLLRKAMIHCQDASPLRLKGLHFIGMPVYFRAIFKILLQVLNEKNKKKIHLYNIDELHKYIPKEILPFEYGGHGGPIQETVDYWVKKIASYEAFYEEDLQYGTDESKRQGSTRNVESLFGIDGSFRQLEFD